MLLHLAKRIEVEQINRLFFTLCVFFFATLSLGCNHPVNSQAVPPAKARSTADPTYQREDPHQLTDIFVSSDRLSYYGYEVRRLKEKVRYEYPNEKGVTKSDLIEVSYAVVERNRRRLAKFDGVYFGAGNATDFGLFALVGQNSKQLIVSQTIPRGGRHWVVSLSPEFRVLFDSGDYGVGREEFSVLDIDKDGVYEISLPVTAFYIMQDKMYIGEIPLPEIIFKYDAKVKKYFPANSLFQDYVLRGIENDIKKLNGKEESNYLSTRLHIFLRYVYAQEENEAWSFFDREYGLPDKEEMKSRIKSILKDEAVYRYIHRKDAT